MASLWGDSAQPGVSSGKARGGLAVSQLHDASALVRKVDSLKRGRYDLEREWKMNLAFYKGNQYISYNKSSNQIDYLPTEDGEKPRFRVRIVSNQIQVGAHSLLSKLTKTKPVISATPSTGSPADRKAAQFAEMLYQHWWYDLKLQDKLHEALLWGITAGQGYWNISWDRAAGKSMRFMLGPDGNPILDDELQELFRGQLAQMGIEPMEQTVYLGDIRVEAMSPFDVYLDPSAKTFDDCKYAICAHALDVDEIEARWGKRLTPDAISVDPDVALPWKGQSAMEPTVKRVYIGYFLPQPGLPKGRYVVFTDGPTQILDDGPWSFPTAELPLVKFPGVRVPGRVYDDAVVTSARPLQKELNRTISQIVEYKNLTIRPRWSAPVGSMMSKLTNEPGSIVQYQPIGGQKPEAERLPSMPPYVFDHLNNITGRLKEVFGLTEITEGSVPPNVEAGVAIDLLQEMATDRWEPTIQSLENGLARAGKLMIALAQKYYIEPRLIKIHGEGGRLSVKRFVQADIDSNVDFHAEAGSGLPRTRAGRMARIEQLMKMGILRPEQVWKHVDMADMKGIQASWAADEDQAEREHEKLILGVPLNPEEYQHALMAVQMGLNPDNGEPIQSMEEANNILLIAGLKPGPVDNHAVHFQSHGLEMKSVAYENLPVDVRERFRLHAELHQQALQGLPQPEPQAPRVALQLKGTVDPATASQILQQSGVPAEEQNLREPPLASWVSDSLDKPDADAAGNDPLSEADIQLYKADQERARAEQQEVKVEQEKQRLANMRKPQGQ